MGDGDYKTVDYIWPFYKKLKLYNFPKLTLLNI